MLYDVNWQDDWRLWLTAAGLDDAQGKEGTRFTLYSMVLLAAIKGAGVAIGHRALVADDLARKRLVAPFTLRVPAPRAYYLVYPKWSAEHAAVQAFRRWVIAESTRGGAAQALARPRSRRASHS